MPRNEQKPAKTPSGKTDGPRHDTASPRHDETFKRHGPEPPENDAGPSQDGDEMFRSSSSDTRNVDPEQQID